ncbi:MAG: prolipoprotein diacylglyceryl transferase [Spirochaetes bacterium]|nr:prolipoprotein diacylglyceryl transferase [Spirochaetota bacterium]
MKYPEFLSPHVFPPAWPVLGNIRWYGVMYLAGIVVGYFLMKYFIKKGSLKIPLEEKGGLYDFLFYVVIGIIAGARLGFFIFYHPAAFITAPWEIIGLHFDPFYFGFDGMSYHGGMIGLIIAVALFAKRFGYRFYDIADCAAIAVPFGLFFGRMGNFINAELYGRETSGVFGMRFPIYERGYAWWASLAPADRPYTNPRFPSQLYEAALEGLLLFLILFIAYKLKVKRGITFWLYITCYGLFRFLVEFVREPNEWAIGFQNGMHFIQGQATLQQFTGFMFTAGMAYSLPMAIIGIIFIVYRSISPADTIVQAKGVR